MSVYLTLHIHHPTVIRGDDRLRIYNTLNQTMEALGDGWKHQITRAEDGNLLIRFVKERPESVIPGVI